MSTRTRRPPLLSLFTRVTSEAPCPVCGRDDWCLIANAGDQAICTREKSKCPRGSAGWLHNVTGEIKVPPPTEKKTYLKPHEVSQFYKGLGINMDMIHRQSREIGIKGQYLRMMGASYSVPSACLVFPMFNDECNMTGCRFRRSDGRKWSLKGGKEGVFLSSEFNPAKTVYIAEGPTDSAALCQIGITNVIGRPNCSGGVAIIQALLAGNPETKVVILADPDKAGMNGAIDLATKLKGRLAIVLTNAMDMRDLVRKSRYPKNIFDDIASTIRGQARAGWHVVLPPLPSCQS